MTQGLGPDQTTSFLCQGQWPEQGLQLTLSRLGLSKVNSNSVFLYSGPNILLKSKYVFVPMPDIDL